MSYRNKTYVAFDGDKDMWAYAYMLGWKNRDHIDFDFHDAHDLREISERAGEETIKRTLRERFSNSKQFVLIVGESTKYLYKFVRWEIEIALKLQLPIIVVNLNGARTRDTSRCPALLHDCGAVHVSFNRAIIKHAMDNFASNAPSIHASNPSTFYYYPTAVYQGLGLE